MKFWRTKEHEQERWEVVVHLDDGREVRRIESSWAAARAFAGDVCRLGVAITVDGESEHLPAHRITAATTRRADA